MENRKISKKMENRKIGKIEKLRNPSCSNFSPKINSRSREWNLELCNMARCSIEMIEICDRFRVEGPSEGGSHQLKCTCFGCVIT
jgi:hypothetical protein